MITARMTAGRRIATSLAVAALAFGVTSCGAINQQATTDQYNASDGIHVDVANAEVRNLMFVASSDDSKARLIGSVVNDTDSAVSVNIKAGSAAAVSIDVPANQVVKLEDEANKTVISALGVKPGEHAQTTFSSAGKNVDFSVPVVDGTLAEYRDFVPGGYDQATTEHLKPVEHESTSGH